MSFQENINLNLPLFTAYALGLQRALPHFQTYSHLFKPCATRPSVDEIFNKYNDDLVIKNYVEINKGSPLIKIDNINEIK